MSDFDKEAERQKLREKFDRDREKRKETERMSQLLLQGATMTNRHCDTCGDPLFRYQDQEFCATCQGRAQEAQADAQNAQAQAQGDAQNTQETSAQAEPAETPPETAATPTSETTESQTAGEETTGDQAARTSGATTGSVQQSASTASREQAVDPGRGDGTLTAARESLIRTLTHHAQRAEAVDDPRRATDHLKAVREAAEALSALERGR